MGYVDSAVLDLTERGCRRFQVLTGRTNLWLALQLTNLSIVVYFVWAGVAFWNTDVITRVGLALFCGGVLYLLTQTVLKESIEEYERDAYRRVAKGYRNPRRVRDASLRISFLSLCLFLLVPMALAYTRLHLRLALSSYSLIVLTTAVLYVLACDPLPPCAGRLEQWLRRLVPARAAAAPAADQGSSRPSNRRMWRFARAM